MAVSRRRAVAAQLLHIGHSLLHEPVLPHPLLHTLLTEVLLDTGTHGHRALVLCAALGMRITQQQELLANGAATRHS